MKTLFLIFCGAVSMFYSTNSTTPNEDKKKALSHYCTFASTNSNIDNVEVWFDDPDGDCKSNSHYTTYHFIDGKETSYDTGEIFGELDFSKFTCCNMLVNNDDNCQEESEKIPQVQDALEQLVAMAH